MKIVIHKNPNGDTRTAPKGITFKQFQEANDSHIADVRAVMDEIAAYALEKWRESRLYEEIRRKDVLR